MTDRQTKELVKEILNTSSQISIESLNNIAFLIDYYTYQKTQRPLTQTIYKSILDGVTSPDIEKSFVELLENDNTLIKEQQKIAGNEYTVLKPKSEYNTTLSTKEKEFVFSVAQQWLEESPDRVTEHIKHIVPRGQPKIGGPVDFKQLNDLKPMTKRQLDIKFD